MKRIQSVLLIFSLLFLLPVAVEKIHRRKVADKPQILLLREKAFQSPKQFRRRRAQRMDNRQITL